MGNLQHLYRDIYRDVYVTFYTNTLVLVVKDEDNTNAVILTKKEAEELLDRLMERFKD